MKISDWNMRHEINDIILDIIKGSIMRGMPDPSIFCL